MLMQTANVCTWYVKMHAVHVYMQSLKIKLWLKPDAETWKIKGRKGRSLKISCVCVFGGGGEGGGGEQKAHIYIYSFSYSYSKLHFGSMQTHTVTHSHTHAHTHGRTHTIIHTCTSSGGWHKHTQMPIGTQNLQVIWTQNLISRMRICTIHYSKFIQLQLLVLSQYHCM